MLKSNVNGTELPSSGEPSEHDPCICDQKDSNIFVRVRNNACKQWQLSHKLFYVGIAMLVALVILLIVVIALAASWPHIPHSHQFPVCRRVECLEAAGQIQEVMNNSASPCTDLWGWACGNWHQKYPLPKDKSAWNQKQRLAKQEALEIRNLITTLPLPIPTETVNWKLNYLYEACLDVDMLVDIDGARPLTTIIHQLGGWNILRNWNRADFVPRDLLLKLQVRYGVSPFFRITVDNDPRTSGRSIIRIAPAGLGLPSRDYYYMDQDDKYQIAYRELIRDIANKLASATYEAEKFGNNMFFYEQRIADITPNTSFLSNVAETSNIRRVAQLKEAAPQIKIDDILRAMYPKSEITENTEVIVSSMEYLSGVSEILSTTDKTILNSYLIWTLVRNYLPYLSHEFISIWDTFESKVYGIAQPLERWEMCANLVQRFMGLAINVLNEKSDPISPDTHSVVNETFYSILNVVQKRFSLRKDKIELRMKLPNVALQIGLPAAAKTDAYLKEYYQTLQIMKKNLFDSVINGVAFEKQIEDIRLVKNKLTRNNVIAPSGPDDDVLALILRKMPPRVGYSPSANAVVVPHSLLTRPYFDNKYPKSVIYGRLGVEIATAILDAILLPHDRTMNSTKLFWKESLKTAKSCLHRSISNLFGSDMETAEETVSATLNHVSAVGIANNALQGILAKDTQQHVHQPSLEEFEDSGVFFLAYAQTQCSESTSQHQLFESIVNFQLTQRSMLDVVWTHLPEFAEEFDCTFDSKLKCSSLFF